MLLRTFASRLRAFVRGAAKLMSTKTDGALPFLRDSVAEFFWMINHLSPRRSQPSFGSIQLSR